MDTVKTELGVLERVQQNDGALMSAAENFVQRGVLGQSSVPQEAINAIQQANVKRDQAYTGNNVNNVGYYLEPGLKFIVPQLTPLSNMLPRTPLTLDGKGIDTIRVRSVLDYFGGGGPSVLAGVLGQRGNPNRGSFSYKDLSFTAKMIAWSDVVTDEDIIYGEEFAGDVLQMAASALMPAWKQIEECWLINSSKQLWPPTSPLVSASTTGGTIAAGTYWVKVTAYNANGETLSNPAVSVTTTGTTSSLNVTLFSNPQGVGVVGYRVYVASGTNLPADSTFYLQAASNYASGATPVQTVGLRQGWQNVTLTSLTTSGTTPYATVYTNYNNNVNVPYLIVDTDPASAGIPLTFDGMIATVLANAGGAPSTYGVGNLTPLVRQPASNGTITATDINQLLEDGFLNAHADYDTIFCSVKDRAYLTKLVAQASNTRIVLNADGGNDQGNLSVGYRVSTYLNPNTERLIDIKTLPYMQQGTLVFASMQFPYPVPGYNTNAPVRVGVNRELFSRVLLPDQSHQSQTTVTAFGNECFINEYIGGWAAITGITGA